MSLGMLKLSKRMRPSLGTFVEIGGYAEASCFESGIARAYKTIEKAQKLLSFHDVESELSQLNRSVCKEISLNPVTIRALRLAKLMTKASNSLFNLTIGGRMIELGILPNHGQDFFLPVGQEEDLLLSENKAMLRRPVRLTLDGIAKGLCVDLAVRELRNSGFAGGWVNAGGDLRVFGCYPVPVHLRESIGEIVKLGNFQNVSIATSEVRKVSDEHFAGQITSVRNVTIPKGRWTVQSRFAWKADALTKVACLATPDSRSHVIQKLGGKLLVDWTDDK